MKAGTHFITDPGVRYYFTPIQVFLREMRQIDYENSLFVDRSFLLCFVFH